MMFEPQGLWDTEISSGKLEIDMKPTDTIREVSWDKEWYYLLLTAQRHVQLTKTGENHGNLPLSEMAYLLKYMEGIQKTNVSLWEQFAYTRHLSLQK